MSVPQMTPSDFTQLVEDIRAIYEQWMAEDKHLRECAATYCSECDRIRAKRKGEK